MLPTEPVNPVSAVVFCLECRKKYFDLLHNCDGEHGLCQKEVHRGHCPLCINSLRRNYKLPSPPEEHCHDKMHYGDCAECLKSLEKSFRRQSPRDEQLVNKPRLVHVPKKAP